MKDFLYIFLSLSSALLFLVFAMLSGNYSASLLFRCQASTLSPRLPCVANNFSLQYLAFLPFLFFPIVYKIFQRSVKPTLGTSCRNMQCRKKHGNSFIILFLKSKFIFNFAFTIFSIFVITVGICFFPEAFEFPFICFIFIGKIMNNVLVI